ncbi:MAG: transporter substrate-binding domain-containing protein, partial [Thermoanaerobaculales bacterium]|nr:transporter substrate-binding domain-containing protein [Thermoanaerobaculales bacterium]
MTMPRTIIVSLHPKPLLRGLVRSSLAACLAAVALAVSAAEPRELKLGSDEWPPFTGSVEQQRAALDLVHTALDRAGISAATAIHDWKHVEIAIRRGELDGSAAMWRNAIREKDLLFSAPYLENRLILIGAKGSDVTATHMSELTGKRVAAVGHYAYGEDIERVEGVYFVSSHNDQDSLDKLLAGDVDYILVDELVAQHLVTYQPDEAAANLEIGMKPLARRTLHFAIRRDVPNADKIIARFNAEIPKLQADGTYARILNVGWIRVDADGDGLYELVPFGESVGQMPPGRVYDVFGDLPEAEEPDET